MWRKGSFVIFYILLQHVQSVKICSSEVSSIQRNVEVQMDNVTGPCTCDIEVFHSDKNPPSVILKFRNTQSNDEFCSNFKLVFDNQIIYKTWCGNDSDFSTTLNTLDSSNLSMIVKGSRNSFKFNVSTARSGNLLQIVCKGSPPTTSSRPTSSLPSTTTIFNQFNTDQVTIPTSSIITQITTELTTSTQITTELTTSTEMTQITTEQLTRNNNDSDDVSNLAIILGCSIGGTVVIIIIIAGCVLLRRRNRQKKTNTENATHGTTKMSVYSSIDDDLKVSGQYEQITRHQPEQHGPEQQEHGPEQLEHGPGQQGHVPNRSNEYVNVTKESISVLIGDNGIELNNNMKACISKVKNNYENVKERKNIILK